MKLYTIGFTKKPARVFFETLRGSGANRLVDVRLNNVSQLAGFAKRDDLAYFLGSIASMRYSHELELAPTPDLLRAYRRGDIDWEHYEDRFIELMQSRRIENISRDLLASSCLLCSEDGAARCHRRLVAEYLQECWGNVEIVHL
jgi:uncharacterized protein (DUF488 family)